MVRGYHVYKDLWTAVVGEGLQCGRESGNFRDPFAVAVKKNSDMLAMFQGGFLLSVPCFYIGTDQFIEELLLAGAIQLI